MLSSSALADLSVMGWALFALVILTVLVSVLYQAREAREEMRLRKEGWWLPGAWLGALCTAVTCAALVSDGSLHVHHYMWSAAMAVFMRYPSRVSVYSQAICIGICHQELAAGGLYPFFD